MKQQHKGKYGYVEFVDKRKLKYDGWDDQIEPEIRKPTPKEREEIILNYIRANSGKSVKVWWLAEKLAVSDRMIQKILKKFEEQGLIARTPLFTESGKQQGNILTYTGENTPKTGTELTLQRLYNPDNPCGFRDWHWEEFKFIPGYYDGHITEDMITIQKSYLNDLKAEQQRKKDKFYKKKK